MPNHFHYRATIDRLWRRSAADNPGHVRLKALDAVAGELFAPTARARLNYRMYLATDPYDVARHKLRDLYDHASPDCSTSPSPASTAAPAPAVTAGPEVSQTEEDDDPW